MTQVFHTDPGLCVSVLSKCLSVCVHSTLSTLSTTVQVSAVQAVCLCPLCKCPPPPRYSPAAHHSLSPLLLSPRLELIYYSVAARSRGAVQSARCRARGGSLAGCSSRSSARSSRRLAALPPRSMASSSVQSSSSSQRPAPPPANGRPVGRPNTLRGELTVNADKESG